MSPAAKIAMKVIEWGGLALAVGCLAASVIASFARPPLLILSFANVLLLAYWPSWHRMGQRLRGERNWHDTGDGWR